MAKIHILPPEVANQIAAGEVVERPSSVVKELVENSLDAGATEVRVEVREAGRRLIQVTDNGRGMDASDLPLCIARHATSKIGKAEDLWGVSTFGFRGEALPSIASVSLMAISSRVPGSAVAYKLRVEGGRGLPLEEDNLAAGTRVTVQDLFYNTPARLKFLKAPSTETSRLQAALTGLALANPQAAFSLVQDGRESFRFNPAADLAGRVGQVLGASFLDQSLHAVSDAGGLRMQGWVGRPHTHRSNRTGQYFFVNGRAVDHRFLNFVLSQAYGNLLPQGRYTVAALYLDLPPKDVDVNVHPAKREVRFRDENGVMDFVRHAVANALGRGKLMVPMTLRSEAVESPEVRGQRYEQGVSTVLASGLLPHASGVAESTFGFYAVGVSAAPAPHQSASPIQAPAVALNPGWPRPLAQLHRTYLLCQDDSGLVLIDQHAAHERVLFERYMNQLAAGQVKSQALLLPLKLTLGPAQAARMREWIPNLGGLGLEISDMGVELFYVVSVPEFLKGVQVAPLIQDLLNEVAEEADTDPMGTFREEVAARMACRAAVKAGDGLNLEEMTGLVNDLSACKLPWACPHGRPPLVSVSLAELEKYFQRS